jgi:hypothetical protein
MLMPEDGVAPFRLLAHIAALLVAASVVACDRDDAPSTTPSATPGAGAATAAPTASPTAESRVSISASAPADVVLSGAGVPESGGFFVVDLRSRLVQRIDAPPKGVAWLNDDTLRLTVGDTRYHLTLAGLVTAEPESISVPPTSPPADTALRSADGAWGHSPYGPPSANWLITPASQRAPDDVLYLENAGALRWSPLGHRLAFVGNHCAGHDLFVLQPDSSLLTNLSERIDSTVVEFIWRPNGRALAVFAVAGDSRRIVELDAETGEDDVLVTMHGTGETIPMAYNPSGTHLLFVARRVGRGLCEDGVPRLTRVGTAPP